MYNIKFAVEEIKKIYVEYSRPNHRPSDKKAREELLPKLIREQAIIFVKNFDTPEDGLRQLPGWCSAIKFALQTWDPVMYRDIDTWLAKGTRLLSNDL